MKPRRLLIKLCNAFRINKKVKNLPIEFHGRLHTKGLERAKRELTKEMQFAEYVDDLVKKHELGIPLTQKEALSIGMLKISK